MGIKFSFQSYQIRSSSFAVPWVIGWYDLNYGIFNSEFNKLLYIFSHFVVLSRDGRPQWLFSRVFQTYTSLIEKFERHYHCSWHKKNYEVIKTSLKMI